jgi:transcriptional regulator with XRE-family HTH domain
MDAHVSWPANKMSVAEFDAEYQRITDTYGKSKAEAGARFEQELARFFHRAKGAGWTQERIAKQIGKSQSYVSRLLCFGAFLGFMPVGINPEIPLKKLCERDFRRYWERTDKTEQNDNVRFKQVVRLLDEATRFANVPKRDRVAPAILEHFAGGKYAKLEEIQTKIDGPADLVKHELDRMVRGEYRGWRGDRKPTGDTMKYRFFPADKKTAKAVKLIASTEIEIELGPIIEVLMMEGRKNSVTISPMTVDEQARKLKRLFENWTK